MAYYHTQRGRFHWLLLLLGLAAAFGSIFLFEESGPPVALAVGLAGLLMVGASLCFAHLTVREEGKRLTVRFGPLDLVGTSVRYADIRSFRTARSRWIDGFGIHWLPGRGWIWNLWGFDCVELEVEGRRGPLRIGTDDLEGLARHLGDRTRGG